MATKIEPAKVVGSGPERIIAVAGWMGDHHLFDPFMPLVDPVRYSIALLDARGYGSRKDCGGPFTIEQIAADIVRKVALHPFILSTAAGFLAAGLQFEQPSALRQFIDYLAQAAAPCALFAMGVTLALRPLKRVPVEISYIVPAKLIVHPLVVYAALTLVGGFEPVWVYAAVLLAALPTATNVFVLGQLYHVWQERASATILITTALSVVTVSMFLIAIKSGFLPA